MASAEGLSDPAPSSSAKGGSALLYRTALSVFAFALALRLGWIANAGNDALRYSDDAKAYEDIAVNLIGQHRYVTAMDPPHRLDLPYAQRPPLTPLLIAGVYSLFGQHLLPLQVTLAALGALTAALMVVLGRRLFSNRVGAVAGFVTAVYPFFIFLAAIPLTENLAALLFVLLALALTATAVGRSVKHAAVTGLVLGLASLDRPQVLGFVPFAILVGWVAGDNRSGRLRWIGMLLTCFALALAPWSIRNRLALRRWVPVSTQGGWALYEGNNPYTQTALDKLWNGARGWYNDPGFGPGLTGPTAADMDRQAFHLASEYIRQRPAQALWYSVQKAALFFTAYAHPVARISWYPILALGLLGAILTRAHWRRLLPVYLLILQTILTAAVFTSMPRFRAPVEPFFILLAAFSSCHLWDRRRLPQSLRAPLYKAIGVLR